MSATNPRQTGEGPAAAGVVVGGWKVLEVAGPTERGMAYRVEGVNDGRTARLELWDPVHVEPRGALARFDREARVLGRLRHDRCLSLLEFGTHDGRPFLVSELPAGKPLRDERGTAEMPVARAVALMGQVLEGLRHLHRHGVVHRAVAPDNVWVGSGLTSDQVKLGLPRVASSGDRADQRGDVDAAGRMLFALCTGREPAAGLEAPRALAPERGIGEALERVLMRAVARSPEARFRTADELMGALGALGLRNGRPRAAPAASPARTTLVAALAAVGLAGAVALSALVVRGGKKQPPPPAPEVATAARPAPSPEPEPEPAPAPAPPPVVTKPAPPPPPPPARPVEKPAPPPAAASGDRQEIWALLDGGKLDEAGARINALVASEPQAAWPRLLQGALFQRRAWRRDAINQWEWALAREPELADDPQVGAHLCFMLDAKWQAAGVGRILDRLGARAAPLLERCAAGARTPQLRGQAAAARADLSRSRAGRPASPADAPGER